MGFFSSRKSTQSAPAPVRSRFYGKARETRELPSRPSFDRHGKLPVERSVRPSTDPLTMTLAQRLNELAIANDQGLLDDDEYRLLRQNLFERFTSTTETPTEVPIVKLANLGQVPVPHPIASSSRPESLRSKVSFTNLSGMFRKATRRTSSSDSMSIMSTTSNQSRTFPRRSVAKQASQASLSREHDRNSNRQNVPPSAFSNRGIRSIKIRNTPAPEETDGEHTQSVKEIRQEIEDVEAEGRRLLDAFNGLELSTLTRTQRRPAIPISSPSMRGDSDTMSVHSSGSMSLRRTPSGRMGSPLVSQPISLSRKNSFSSVSSRGKSIANFGPIPPVPSLPSSPLGRLGAGSTSSISLNRGGYFPLATVEEKRVVPLGSLSYMASNDPTIQLLESDMADIRRRREEVVARYEERLEFLRVKLKGAEMHEKLLKR